jgi:dTDP-4-amino-4,6-dideoxygalactose transaminase
VRGPERSIPQANPGAGYLARKEAIDAAVARVLDRGRYILGPEVGAFEQEFASYLGLSNVVGVASGTDALCLALKAEGVGEGDVVFTVSHTAVATVVAITMSGAMPVTVDVSPETLTMDPARLEEAILNTKSGRPRAVIPVHLYGRAADMGPLMEIAGNYGLTVVEDCAQAHGAVINGRKAGTFGKMAAFSFYPTKNLGAFGDGGAVATDDERLAARLRGLREYGWRERYVSEEAGLNSRLDELQAAILRVRLPRLDEENRRRREIAALYSLLLDGSGLKLPVEKAGMTHVYHQYVVEAEERDHLKAFLKENGIGAAIHYPVPIHLQPAYGETHIAPYPLPVTERAAGRILSLPMYPQLGDDEIRHVCERILTWRLR